MNKLISNSLSRFAFAAILAASVAAPLVTGSSPASAMATGAPGGATGGSTGGGSTGGGGGGNPLRCGANCPPPVFVRYAPPQRHNAQSCQRFEPIFDRWGDYVGERAVNFCGEN